jgi:hypothetical protein
VLHYFNEKLEPLYPEMGEFQQLDWNDKLMNYGLFKDPRNLSFIEHKISGKNFLLPVVNSPGLRPAPDRSRREKRNPESSRSSYTYYVEPHTTGGVFGFRLRVIDSASLTEDVLEKLDLRFYDKIELVSPLSQGRYLFRVGQLDFAKTFVASWNQGSWSWSLVDLGSSFLGSRVLPYIGGVDETAIYSQSDLRRAQLNVLDIKSPVQLSRPYVLDIPDPTEFILSPLLVGNFNASLGVIVEASQELFAYLWSSNKVAVFRAPLARSMFLGRLITQVTKPVLLEGQPSLYVDNSVVNSPNVFLWELNENGFSVRLKNSHFVRANCKTQDPVRWSGENTHRFTMLCTDEDEPTIFVLPAGA